MARANRERGEIDLLVGERSLVLRLSISAVVALEASTGRTFADILEGVKQRRLQDELWLLWAALQPYHGPQFAGLSEVQALIDDVGTYLASLEALRRAIGELLQVNGPPQVAEVASADPRSAQAGTGSASTLALAESV